MRKKEKSIEFTDRVHPMSGILCAIIGCVLFLLLLIICIISGAKKGNVEMVYANIGILSMFVATGAFVFSVLCFKKEDIYLRFPILGAVFNGLVAISYMALYFIGMI